MKTDNPLINSTKEFKGGVSIQTLTLQEDEIGY